MSDEPYENRWGHLWSVRLGFAHIPKTAGQSLGLAISEAWGLRYRSINSIPKQEQSAPNSPHSYSPFSMKPGVQINLERSEGVWPNPSYSGFLSGDPLSISAIEPTFDLPFLSGHVGIKQMRMLGRSSLMTVLRNPHERALSEHAFSRFVCQEEGQMDVEKTLREDVLGYLSRRHNVMFRFLLLDAEHDYLSPSEWAEFLESGEVRGFSEYTWREMARAILSEFQLCFVGTDVQKILDALFERGYLPRPWSAKRINSTRLLPEPAVVKERDLLDTVIQANHKDSILVEEASQLFPDLVVSPGITPNEHLVAVGPKYGLTLA